jgi:hypothetical protein
MSALYDNRADEHRLPRIAAPLTPFWMRIRAQRTLSLCFRDHIGQSMLRSGIAGAPRSLAKLVCSFQGCD